MTRLRATAVRFPRCPAAGQPVTRSALRCRDAADPGAHDSRGGEAGLEGARTAARETNKLPPLLLLLLLRRQPPQQSCSTCGPCACHAAAAIFQLLPGTKEHRGTYATPLQVPACWLLSGSGQRWKE